MTLMSEYSTVLVYSYCTVAANPGMVRAAQVAQALYVLKRYFVRCTHNNPYFFGLYIGEIGHVQIY